VREAWVSDLAAALRQEDAGAYVNLLGDDGQARLCQVYPGRTLDRLPQPAGTGVDQDLVERIENELERAGVLGRPGRVDAMAFLDLVGYTRLTEDQVMRPPPRWPRPWPCWSPGRLASTAASR
jgi:hypothetical protein